ncbi:hypothetical protein A9Q99_20590 [Gammaproteobacteria bacterium 45_16_T64]|nr:hypothetical protein A9Q99_20590 [Gammaproteobacteria bacterium 45_16_T64]
MPPSDQLTGFLRSSWIIAQFELIRLFGTARGLLTLFTFAVIWYFMLTNLVMTAANFIEQNASTRMSTMMFNSSGFGQLLAWPIAEFSAYWRIALYLFPVFAVLFAADQTASDRDRGGLRFLTTRCSRDSIFLGRFIGQTIIVSFLVVGTLLTTLAVALYAHPAESWPMSFYCTLLIATNLLAVLMPYTAMMALLSASVRSPILAIILAVLLWTIVLWSVTALSEYYPAFDFVKYIIPGIQISDLTQLQPADTLSLIHIPLLQTAVLLIIGRFVMAKGAI